MRFLELMPSIQYSLAHSHRCVAATNTVAIDTYREYLMEDSHALVNRQGERGTVTVSEGLSSDQL